MAGRTEKGICFLCGKAGSAGMPARPDVIISAARKIRSLLRLPEKHTVACLACLPECRRRSAAFEKRLAGYRLGAILFFLLVVAGSVFFGRIDFSAFAGGIAGGLFILALAYAAYCPKFEIADGKTP